MEIWLVELCAEVGRQRYDIELSKCMDDILSLTEVPLADV